MTTEVKRYGTDPDGDPEAPGLTVIQIAEEDIANPYYPTIAARELAQDLLTAQARIAELEGYRLNEDLLAAQDRIAELEEQLDRDQQPSDELIQFWNGTTHMPRRTT